MGADKVVEKPFLSGFWLNKRRRMCNERRKEEERAEEKEEELNFKQEDTGNYQCIENCSSTSLL